MFCAVDIGNSAIKLGCYSSKSQSEFYSYSYRNSIDSVNEVDFFKPMATILQRAEHFGVSSVVPQRLEQFVRFLSTEFLSIPITIVKHELINSLNNRYIPPDSVGIDRFIGVFEAAMCYGTPVVTVDMGTATTINVVNDKSEFVGGVILPGYVTSLTALERETTLKGILSDNFELKDIVANSTIEGIRIGLFVNQLYTIEKYLDHLMNLLPIQPIVVLTGGNAFRFSSSFSHRIKINPNLVLDGIFRICSSIV